MPNEVVLMSKNLCVIGLGYIGLPTAAMFADSDWDVIGVDINPEIVANLNKGIINIEEHGLGDLVAKVVNGGNFCAKLEPTYADCFIISVPTPYKEGHSADLKYVEEAIYSILPYLNNGNIVIVESTVPPRTMNDVVAPILESQGWAVGEEIYLAHCPERVLPGRILAELVENTRIIGGINHKSAEIAAQVYRGFVTGKIHITSAINAEMSKLMENTFRDVNIALSNELVKISEKLDINPLEVIRLANYHPRVNLHLPGPGVGGHCLAIDPYFIIEKAPEQTILISGSRTINNSMPKFVVDQLKKILPNKASKVAILGLSYKGNIDDVRESPALDVLSLLNEEGYELGIYDPHVKQDQVNFCLSNFEDSIKGANCILVLTDHREFSSLNEEVILKLMNNPVVFDTRNCVKVKDSKITYINYNNIFEIDRLTRQQKLVM